ncbi:hypothetical protein ACFODZ_00705 [Marinicella sediminis]|uniref:Helitron helicase-like domain-containing protein n=1 Tax=Marinicella sediminis TaxID=1792834 RepID=A0ABV7J7U5_9GAMM|nr:hypothetical protein [Marinicella sediminis]
MTIARRPTIPFAQWKLAVDLKATRKLQNQAGMPAFGCACDVCADWKKLYKKIIPGQMSEQLNRIGVDQQHPTDIYAFMESENDRAIRVLFHFIGKILSGPGAQTFCNKVHGQIMNYVPQGYENFFSIMVLPANQSFETAPRRSDGSHDQVVCIDMRLMYSLPQ